MSDTLLKSIVRQNICKRTDNILMDVLVRFLHNRALLNVFISFNIKDNSLLTNLDCFIMTSHKEPLKYVPFVNTELIEIIAYHELI